MCQYLVSPYLISFYLAEYGVRNTDIHTETFSIGFPPVQYRHQSPFANLNPNG